MASSSSGSGLTLFSNVKNQPNETPDIFEVSTVADLSQLETSTCDLAVAWDLLRPHIDSVIASENLTCIPTFAGLETEAQEGDDDSDGTDEFDVGAIFVKIAQSGARFRRNRTYSYLGSVDDLLDPAESHPSWKELTLPEFEQVMQPSSIVVKLSDSAVPATLEITLRDLQLSKLARLPPIGQLSLKRQSASRFRTVYFVTSSLQAKEVEIKMTAADRERVFYRADPIALAVSYRKLALNSASRVTAPRKTIVSMARATWKKMETLAGIVGTSV